MNYLYHIVPEKIEGNVLYPLSELKKKYPKIYKKEVKKYQGREYLLTDKLEPFNCLWGEVLFFTAVHPKKLKKALRKAGRKEFRKLKWFKINPYKLEKSKTLAYLYLSDKMSERNSKKQFRKFDPKEISKYNNISKKTLDYFREKIRKGERPLFFHFVPHIIYKGSLNINDLEIIKW